MLVNARTVMIIIVLVIIVGAIYGITLYQRAAKTAEYLVDLDSGDTAAVLKAMDGLSSRGRSVVPRLSETLDNLNPQVRSRAVMLIGVCGDAADSALLPPLLKSDKDKFVRRDAAIALGKLGGDGVVAALTESLRNQSEDVLVRAAAAASLGILGEAGSVAALVEALVARPPAAKPPGDEGGEAAAETEAPEDSSLFLRVAAARALGRLGTDDGIRALGDAVHENTEPSERVRATASYALGDVALNNENEDQMAVILDNLLAAFDDSAGDVRIAAIQSLGKASLIPEGAKHRVDSVLTRAEGDEHYWVREAAEEARTSLGPLGI